MRQKKLTNTNSTEGSYEANVCQEPFH